MKRTFSLAIVLAMLLTLFTACAEAGTANNSSADAPLGKVSWAATLDEAMKAYPGGSTSTTGEDRDQRTVYSVSQGDFGKALGVPVVAADLTFRPALSYNGTENAQALSMVTLKLRSTDYDALCAALDKQYGQGKDGQGIHAGGSRNWSTKSGLRELDAKTAALAVALNPVPAEAVWSTLTSGGELAEDASAWPGLDLANTESCKAVLALLDDLDVVRRVSLEKGEDALFLNYIAGGMTYVPLAQSILGK